jgi:hypothetical protein
MALAMSVFAAEKTVTLTNTYPINSISECINGTVFVMEKRTKKRCDFIEKKIDTDMPIEAMSIEDRLYQSYKTIRYKFFGSKLHARNEVVGKNGWGMSYTCQEFPQSLIVKHGYERYFNMPHVQKFCKELNHYPVALTFHKAGLSTKYDTRELKLLK